MIIYDMALQWRMLAYSLIVGLALGVFYDAMRISRLFLTLPASPTSPKYYRVLSRFKLFRRSHQVAAEISGEPDNAAFRVNDFAVGVVAFIEDILFFVIAALVLTVFIFHANTGSVRGFTLLGALVGFVLYLFSIGRVTLFFGELVVFLIRELINWIYILLVLPFFRMVRRVSAWIYNNTIGRINAHRHKARLRRNTERQSRELTAFCANLAPYFMKQSGRKMKNEVHQNEHSRQAHGVSDLRVPDHHLRERGDKVQQARGGTDQPAKPNRRGKRQHRGASKQIEHPV